MQDSAHMSSPGQTDDNTSTHIIYFLKRQAWQPDKRSMCIHEALYDV